MEKNRSNGSAKGLRKKREREDFTEKEACNNMVSVRSYVNENEVFQSLTRDFPRGAALEEIRSHILARRGIQDQRTADYLVPIETLKGCLDSLFDSKKVLKFTDDCTDALYLPIPEIAPQQYL